MKKISIKVRELREYSDMSIEWVYVDMFACATAKGTNFDGVQRLLNRRKEYNNYLSKEEIKEMVSTYYIFVKGFGEVTENNINEFIENYC